MRRRFRNLWTAGLLRASDEAALRSEQAIELERLWYRAEQHRDFSAQLLQLQQRLRLGRTCRSGTGPV